MCSDNFITHKLGEEINLQKAFCYLQIQRKSKIALWSEYFLKCMVLLIRMAKLWNIFIWIKGLHKFYYLCYNDPIILKFYPSASVPSTPLWPQAYFGGPDIACFSVSYFSVLSVTISLTSIKSLEDWLISHCTRKLVLTFSE